MCEVRKILRHSREGENPSPHYLNARERYSVIPAHAGIQRPTTPTPEKSTPSFPKTLHHSQKHSVIPQNTPSFPRRRESTIPAHAGIQRPTTPTPEKNTPSFPKTLRHSREGGNDGVFFSGVGVVGQWIPQPAPGVADVGNAIDVIVAEYPVASGDHFIQPVETFDCPDQPESLQQSSRQLPQNTCYKIGFEIGYVS